MTRLALIEPQSGGGNWWAIVDVRWSKHDGPSHPQLRIATHTGLPPMPLSSVSEDIESNLIEVTFVKMTHPRARPLWVAQIEAPSETTRLLNIAYTCPETHVDGRPAKLLRDQFERALGVEP